MVVFSGGGKEKAIRTRMLKEDLIEAELANVEKKIEGYLEELK